MPLATQNSAFGPFSACSHPMRAKRYGSRASACAWGFLNHAPCSPVRSWPVSMYLKTDPAVAITRESNSTALLDAGIPVHTVAQRIGDDPATLLRNYTKRKRSKTADAKLSDAIAGLAGGFLGS